MNPNILNTRATAIFSTKACTLHTGLEALRDNGYLQTMPDARLTRNWGELQHKWHTEIISHSCSLSINEPQLQSLPLKLVVYMDCILWGFVVAVVILCNMSSSYYCRVDFFFFLKQWRWWGYLPSQIRTLIHIYQELHAYLLEKIPYSRDPANGSGNQQVITKKNAQKEPMGLFWLM